MSRFFVSIGITTVFVMFLVFIRSVKGEIALPISVCVTVSLAGVAIASCVPIIDYLNTLVQPYSQKYITVLMKTVGISLLTATSADICRDSGETAIASKVELLGKCEILLLSFPLLKDITELLFTVMEAQ